MLAVVVPLSPRHLFVSLALGSFGGGVADGSNPFAAVDRGSSSSLSTPGGPQLPAALGASMAPRLFIQQVDIGALVVRATVQGYIPGKQVMGRVA